MPHARTSATPAATDDAVVAAAKAGDESAFAALVDRHRRELHVHCYRMLGSFDDAEDLVQETFLRAWRRRDRFQGGPGFRAWLYRIATNACLDELRRSRRRVPSLHSFAEVPWLQPYPDRLLDEIAPSDSQPDAVVVTRETIELTFLAVIQLLPPRQSRATGGCCPPAPTASRRPPATCGRRATTSSGRSSSTCCAWRAAPSPRSPPSTPACSRRSVSRRRCDHLRG